MAWEWSWGPKQPDRERKPWGAVMERRILRCPGRMSWAKETGEPAARGSGELVNEVSFFGCGVEFLGLQWTSGAKEIAIWKKRR